MNSLTESISFMETDYLRLKEDNDFLTKTKALLEDQVGNLDRDNLELKRQLVSQRELAEMQISLAESERDTARTRVKETMALIESGSKLLLAGVDKLRDEQAARPASTDVKAEVRVKELSAEDRLPPPQFLLGELGPMVAR